MDFYNSMLKYLSGFMDHDTFREIAEKNDYGSNMELIQSKIPGYDCALLPSTEGGPYYYAWLVPSSKFESEDDIIENLTSLSEKDSNSGFEIRSNIKGLDIDGKITDIEPTKFKRQYDGSYSVLRQGKIYIQKVIKRNEPTYMGKHSIENTNDNLSESYENNQQLEKNNQTNFSVDEIILQEEKKNENKVNESVSQQVDQPSSNDKDLEIRNLKEVVNQQGQTIKDLMSVVESLQKIVMNLDHKVDGAYVAIRENQKMQFELNQDSMKRGK